MLVLRWGPWLRAAAALGAGIAAGALLPGPGGRTGLAVVLLLAAGLLPPALRVASGLGARLSADPRPRSRREYPALVALVALLWVGLALGREARGRAMEACAAALTTGEAVRVRGWVVGWGRYRSGPGRERARMRLEDAVIAGARGECPAGRLLVILSDPPARRPRGGISVAGDWWRYPGARDRPRVPGRHGLVRATESPAPDSASSGAGTTASEREGPLLWRLRRRAAERLASRLDADVAPLGSALLLADRDGLPTDLRDRFAEAGMAHLLAVSGVHVGVLGAMVLGLLGLAVRDRRRYPLAAGLTLAYVVWIGAPPSAVRAALVYTGWTLSRFRGSPISVLELVGGAATAAMLVEPLVLLDVGFQLSFAGFVGLLVGARTVSAAQSGPDGEAGPATGPVALVGASSGAFLATAPLVALHFSRVAPVALISGLAGAPVVGAAVPALAAATVLPEPLGSAASDVATGLLRSLDRLAGLFASVPGGHLRTAPPGPAGWSAIVLSGIGVVRYAASGRPARTALPVAGALAVFLAWPSAAGWSRDGQTRICALDVGQGDAVAIRTARGHWMLVDGGPGPPARRAGLESVVPHLRRAGARSVEVVVLTHPHLDHVGGVRAVLEAFPVREIWDAATVGESRAYLQLLEAAARRGVRWRAVGAGDRFRLDELQGRVLAPETRRRPPGSGPPDRRDPNESSVVLRLRLPMGFTALLTGDAGPREEAWILDRWPAERLRSRLLKVAHHGSRSSTGRRWLAAVRPDVAVISVGEGNRYGHPHPSVLARLREVGVTSIRRTDRLGTVCVRVTEDGAWELDPD